MDKLFTLLKIVVDVACKLLIFNTEFVDRLFKLLKIVVDAVCKLLIFNTEFVDKLFKLVVIAYPDKSGLFIIVEFQSDWKLLFSFPNNWISQKHNCILDTVLLKVKPIYW